MKNKNCFAFFFSLCCDDDLFCEVLVGDQAVYDHAGSVVSIQTPGGNSGGRATLAVFFKCFVCFFLCSVMYVCIRL